MIKTSSLIFCGLIFSTGVWAQTPVFRLHLSIEPTSFSPFLQKNSSSGYFLQSVFSTLLKIQDSKTIPGLAVCEYSQKTQIECLVDKKAKYSNGENILAADFARTLYNFLDPKSKAIRADLFLNIKNAEKISKGEMPIEKLGIKVQDNKLTIDLEKPDPEFIFILASPLLVPLQNLEFPPVEKSANYVFSGPYMVKAWHPKKKIILSPNPHFISKNPRPEIEFLFIAEETVSVQLYESGKLDFLRRLPTLFIPKYKDRPDYFAIPQFRFDYIGFGPALESKPTLRKALVSSLDYNEFQKVYFAKPRPGCVGIPDSYFIKKPCLNYDKNIQKEKQPVPLELIFSKQGGEDHRRSAEWLQSEWHKNLGLKVNLRQLDNKIFIDELNSPQLTLFRKGLAPDRPTCLAVLENFLPGAYENYLKIQDPQFTKWVEQLSLITQPEMKKKICTEALTWLLNQNKMIPTGPQFFSILVNQKWSGWHLNELNHLDLSELHVKNSIKDRH